MTGRRRGGAPLALTALLLCAGRTRGQVVTITSLSPDSAVAGGPAFTLTVNGGVFSPGAVVLWNGAARPTTYVSGSRLAAAISAADIATPGTAAVTVSDPVGGTSNALVFTITPVPAPTPTPTPPPAGGSGQIRVYPNPASAAAPFVIFDNLTPGSTIKIFNAAGRWVRTISASDGKGNWDLNDSRGQSVSSGIYVYLVQGGAGGKSRGTIAVVH